MVVSLSGGAGRVNIWRNAATIGHFAGRGFWNRAAKRD
jgi:hypothetical protein